MSTRHIIDAEIETKFDFGSSVAGEYEVAYPRVQITFTHTRGSPAVMYQRNGDPGWPAESAEIEFISAKLISGDGLTPAQDQVDDWARDWLDGVGYEQACTAAEESDV